MGRQKSVSDDDVVVGAARVIGRVGPARLTLAEVGQEVGLSAATLVQRYGSKRAVLLAVARHGTEALPGRILAAREAKAPVAALIDAFTALAARIRDRTEFANHLAFLLLDLSDPAFQELSEAYTAAVEGAIGEVVAAGQAAGELPRGDLGPLPRAIHAAYNGALVTWGMGGDGGSPADAVRVQMEGLLGAHVRSAAAPGSAAAACN
jgi:AcrR family transcriptional regulator